MGDPLARDKKKTEINKKKYSKIRSVEILYSKQGIPGCMCVT